MGARSGNNYLSSLKKLNAEVWIGGERVGEVTSHPAFRHCARSLASLYDMQIERPEAMTYRTDDGDRAGMSFIQPKSIEELRKRSRMFRRGPNFSGGMLGRTPDYLNASIAAMAAARDFFAASDPRFGDNIANYYLEARKHDWCATHTLLNPRASRAAGWAGHTDADLALKAGRENRRASSSMARGCWRRSGRCRKSSLCFPSTVSRKSRPPSPSRSRSQLTAMRQGLKFICRDSFDSGRSHFDAPLASRFEEMDCVVIFDHVLIPWDRVFLCGDVARCNALYGETNAVVNMMHQVVVKNVGQGRVPARPRGAVSPRSSDAHDPASRARTPCRDDHHRRDRCARACAPPRPMRHRINGAS